jgi:hypothetical protein
MSDPAQAIEYEVGLEDLAEFNVVHLRESVAGKATQRRHTLAAIGGILLTSVVIAIVEGDLTAIVIGLVLCLATPFIIPRLLQRTVRRQAERWFVDDDRERIVGPHRLTLTPAELVGENRSGSLRTDIGSVGPILETDDHVFIYVSSVQAHAVPRAKIGGGDLARFVAKLRERIGATSG